MTNAYTPDVAALPRSGYGCTKNVFCLLLRHLLPRSGCGIGVSGMVLCKGVRISYTPL